MLEPVTRVVCAKHAQREGGECVACQVERYEEALKRLADPMSGLTLRGVMQIAQDALLPRRGG